MFLNCRMLELIEDLAKVILSNPYAQAGIFFFFVAQLKIEQNTVSSTELECFVISNAATLQQ